jgi:hypothetical protein
MDTSIYRRHTRVSATLRQKSLLPVFSFGAEVAIDRNLPPTYTVFRSSSAKTSVFDFDLGEEGERRKDTPLFTSPLFAGQRGAAPPRVCASSCVLPPPRVDAPPLFTAPRVDAPPRVCDSSALLPPRAVCVASRALFPLRVPLPPFCVSMSRAVLPTGMGKYTAIIIDIIYINK